MVRLYIPPRFSKRRMGNDVAQKARTVYGCPTVFQKTRVGHSMACYAHKHGQLFSINVEAGAPMCPTDFWMLQFLRTFSDCIVTTGKILRKEPECFEPRVIKGMGFDPKIFFEKPKPVAILTNTLNSNLMQVGNRLYANTNFKKHILTRPQTLDRLTEFDPEVVAEFARHNTSLDPVSDINLRTGLDYLQRQYGYEMILVEAGASTTVPGYSQTQKVNSRKTPLIDHKCDGNPIDTLYLAIFEGELLESGSDGGDGHIGQPFLNMDWLVSQYNLVYSGKPSKDVYNFNGVCRQTIWKKKSEKELAKIREKTLGLMLAGEDAQSKDSWQQYAYEARKVREEQAKSKQAEKPEQASRSPHFERRKYPYLSDKIHATRKPKV